MLCRTLRVNRQLQASWMASMTLSTSPYLHQGHRPCLKSWKLGFALGHTDSSVLVVPANSMAG